MRLIAFAAPALLLLLVGWTSLSSNATAGTSSVAPSAIQSPSSYIPQKVMSVQSERKANIAQSTQKNAPGDNSFNSDDWQLLLVNSWNNLPADFEVTLTKLKNGHAVDERCYPDLQQMMDDCRAAGLQPVICSSYRTLDYQQKLFDNKVNSLIAQGYKVDAAHEKAATSITVPGTSEHHTGLALDIVDINNQNLNESQENTPAQKWLMENSWRYGFILRYPPDKSDITGITYEPWHYRYVGKAAAKEIKKSGLCLEEYLTD